MRPFRVKLRGSMHTFELYDAQGAEITDLMEAVDRAEEEFGRDWEEVYNGTTGADRSECSGGKLVDFSVDVDKASYVGDGDDGVYYQTFEDGNGKWYMSALADCASASFVDTIVKGDGYYDTKEEAEQAGRDVAWDWCVSNGIDVCEDEG